MSKGEQASMYDVLICGAGPTGVLLAACLSRAGDVQVSLSIDGHAVIDNQQGAAD